MSSANAKLIKLLSEKYKFDENDAIEYVKVSNKKGRPKKEIEVEEAKDLFDKILEQAGEKPIEKDNNTITTSSPQNVEKTEEKAQEKKVSDKEKKAAEKEAKKLEKEKKAAEKEAKKLEKEKKAAEKEAKKLEKEKKAAEKGTKKQVKTAVVAPINNVIQVNSNDNESHEKNTSNNELKPEEKELVVIKFVPPEEFVYDSGDEENSLDTDDTEKIYQSLLKTKLAMYESGLLTKKEKTEEDANDTDDDSSINSDECDDSNDNEDDDNDDKEEIITVKRVKINNQNYLKSSNNVLYDVETNDAIGVWDENKQEIILNELDDDSYDEDE
jgi:hypothetical protein